MAYADLERQGIFFVVTRAEVRYRNPARYDDELTLSTAVARQTLVRYDHHYVLKRGTTVIAEGRTTIACVDRAGAVREIPESLGRATK